VRGDSSPPSWYELRDPADLDDDHADEPEFEPDQLVMTSGVIAWSVLTTYDPDADDSPLGQKPVTRCDGFPSLLVLDFAHARFIQNGRPKLPTD
jgi:hypothetical protein